MATALLLQRTPQRPADSHRPDERTAPEDDTGRILVCGSCLHAITTTGASIEMAGSHAHTFSNPHGLVFHIRCFAVAPGCVAASEASTYFSWFAGYAWKVAVCRGCAEHLGWLFLSDDSRFHGLIADRLAETEGPGSAD
jgi:hypothetical protein